MRWLVISARSTHEQFGGVGSFHTPQPSVVRVRGDPGDRGSTSVIWHSSRVGKQEINLLATVGPQCVPVHRASATFVNQTQASCEIFAGEEHGQKVRSSRCEQPGELF